MGHSLGGPGQTRWISFPKSLFILCVSVVYPAEFKSLISNSFTNFLNRLLVPMLECCVLVNAPAPCNPNQSSLCEMNSMSVEIASKPFMPPVQIQPLPELLFWIPSALVVEPTLSELKEHASTPPSPLLLYHLRRFLTF